MAAQTHEEILDLDALVGVGRPIKVDGKTYHLRTPGDLSLEEYAELQGLQEKIDGLMADYGEAKKADVDDEKVKEITERVAVALDRSVALCSDIDPAQARKLKVAQVSAVVGAFLGQDAVMPNRQQRRAAASKKGQ